jgi:hypothetical protein
VSSTRFFLPWIALISMTASYFIDYILSRKYRFISAAVIITALVLYFNYSLAYTLNFSSLSEKASSRASAGKWINYNLAPKTSIGVFELPQPSIVPPFDFKSYNIQVIPDASLAGKNDYPEYIIMTRASKINMDFIDSYYTLEKVFVHRPAFPLYVKTSDAFYQYNPKVRIYKLKG